MCAVYPYTYMIGWSQLDKWYYGVRYANKIPAADDLWKHYFTSSKYVAQLREQYGDPDVIVIDHEFDTAEEAISYEEQKLKDLNVLHESKWLNQQISGAFGPNCPRGKMFGSDNPQFGKSKAGQLNTFYGRTHSESSKKQMSDSKRKLWKERPHPCIGKSASLETRKKMSLVHKGKKLSKEHIDAIKQGISGEKNHQFKGYYVTPWGRYSTLNEAKVNSPTKISTTSIKNYCLNPGRVIKHTTQLLCEFDQNPKGKTYQELGFGFLAKTD